MSRSIAAIVRWAESRPTRNLINALFWFSMALTFACEVAAITIMTAISTSNIQDESNVWMAVWFFAVGAITWIVGRAGDAESGRAVGCRKDT